MKVLAGLLSNPLKIPVPTLLVLALTALPVRADDWPQWMGPRRDGVWRETGILENFPPGGPEIRWRTPIGLGYAGPAVAEGRVYVLDRVLPEGVKTPESGFSRTVSDGRERVLCLKEADGTVIWKHEYPCKYSIMYGSGPRATPVVHQGKVFTLGAMGNLLCLEAEGGKVIWSKDLAQEYQAPAQLWGFAGHPLIDGDKLICLVGGRGSTVVAFHKDTGKELWRALSAREQGYCPPVIIRAGGKRQLIIWEPTALHSLDPETGDIYWSQKFPVKAALTVPMPRQDGDLLYVTAFYDGSLMMKLDRDRPAATVVWKSDIHSEQPDRTADLHSIIATPVLRDGYIYGVCSYGQLRCVKEANGERVWESLKATTGKLDRWGTAFLIAQGNRYFLFNDLGDLIIARLTPEGYDERSRAHILEPTNRMAGRPVVWSHPAFANRCMYARNDREIVCVNLAGR
jgi:outer membrane protein assembly factor BamB